MRQPLDPAKVSRVRSPRMPERGVPGVVFEGEVIQARGVVARQKGFHKKRGEGGAEVANSRTCTECSSQVSPAEPLGKGLGLMLPEVCSPPSQRVGNLKALNLMGPGRIHL